MSRVYSPTRKSPGKLFPGFLICTIIFLCACSSPRNPEVHTVVIKGMKFLPEVLEVKKGDTVIWINKDIVMHDVTQESDQTWSSGPIGTNVSWKKAITTSEDYFCNLHVIMKGKIIIE